MMATAIAHAMLAGPWTLSEAQLRATEALDGDPRWLLRLVSDLFDDLPPPEPADLVRRLLRRRSFAARVAARVAGDHPGVIRWLRPQLRPRLVPGVPPWHTVGDLATALDVDVGTIDWYADLRAMERRAPPEFRRYRYTWAPKKSGGHRLLEAPRPGLKTAQRKVLALLLDHIPPHPAAVGFRPGGSVLTHASAHAGKRCVLRMDLEDFFASTPRRAVLRVFRTAGYLAPVARTLAGLCTNVTPDAVRFPPPWPPSSPAVRAASRLLVPHLPQGAPTSPALANLCARRLDKRLSGLAATADLAYTRYADDLAFSGDLSPAAARRLATTVAAIALEEGYAVNHRKTKVMPASARQELTGVVVNTIPAVARRERDRLEAILHGCVRTGPQAQNRWGHADFRAHLQGRIAWVAQVHPRHAERLRALFERIDW